MLVLQQSKVFTCSFLVKRENMQETHSLMAPVCWSSSRPLGVTAKFSRLSNNVSSQRSLESRGQAVSYSCDFTQINGKQFSLTQIKEILKVGNSAALVKNISTPLVLVVIFYQFVVLQKELHALVQFVYCQETSSQQGSIWKCAMCMQNKRFMLCTVITLIKGIPG